MRCWTLLLAGALVLSAQNTSPDLFQWKATTPLNEARAAACSVKLTDGRVLVSGGYSGAYALNSTELYQAGKGFVMAGYMASARAWHTCTLLDDGRVLAYGGADSAELYDPATNRWEQLETRGPARWGHTATKLVTGDVVFVGGITVSGLTGAVERWNSATGRFELLTATLSRARKEHATSLLPNGKLLITGGTDGSRAFATTEILDPWQDQVTAGPNLPRARSGHTAVSLYDDRVLIAGGAGDSSEIAEVEVYRPELERFETLAAKMKTPRRAQLALFLEGNGAVLLAGGTAGGEVTGTTEVFQPWDNTLVDAGALTLGRSSISGAVMDGGEVLAVGGAARNGVTKACGVLTTPTIRMFPDGASTRSGVYEGEKVMVEAANWGTANLFLSASLQFPDGRQIDYSTFLKRTLILSLSGPVEVFSVDSFGMHGDRFIVTATDGLRSAQATLDVKQPTSISFEDNGGTILGQPVRLDVFVSAVRPATAASTALVGSMPVVNGIVRGSFLDPSGRRTNQTTFNATSLRPSGVVGLDICCATAIGTFQLDAISFPSTRNYVGTTYPSSDPRLSVRVYDNVPAFSIFGSNFILGVQSSYRAQLNSPVRVFPGLTGTLSIGRPKATAETVLINTAGDGPQRSYTPVVNDLTGICFVAEYSGNSAWKPFRDTKCYPVSPTPASISISSSSSRYAWGTPISLPVTLNWTAPDARLLNTTATITAIGGFGTSGRSVLGSVTLGRTSLTSAATAAGSSMWSLPQNVTGLEVSYTGSTDMKDSTAVIPIAMDPVPTATSLTLTTISGRDITLTAAVRPAPVTPVPGIYTAQPFYAGVAGTMRFFDGTLFLGSIIIPTNLDKSSQATFTALSVSSGLHDFKAVFESASARTYGGSESSLTVNVK